jgi:hypothetical protein
MKKTWNSLKIYGIFDSLFKSPHAELHDAQQWQLIAFFKLILSFYCRVIIHNKFLEIVKKLNKNLHKIKLENEENYSSS